MKILVDADSCPVKDIIEEIAMAFNLPVILFANPSHHIHSTYSELVLTDGSSQAVDLALTNMANKGDVVVTQDYGLACMVLAKGAFAINPSGMVFSDNNIDILMMQRYFNWKARHQGQRIISPKKRNKSNDEKFRINLVNLVEKNL